MLNLDRNTGPWFIDWLNVRVFLQVALIYLCLHVITVAGLHRSEPHRSESN